MKKIIALLLACLMIFGMAACGEKDVAETTADSTEIATQGSLPEGHTPEDTTPAVTDITLKVWAPEADLGKDNKGWLPKQCEKFAQELPQYNITWTYEACETDAVAAKVAADPAAVADVFVYSHTQLDALLEAGVLASLDSEVLMQAEEDNTDEVLAVFTRKLTVTDEADREEAIYGVPGAVDTWVMYYNKSLFTAENVKSLDTMLTKGKVAFPLTDADYFASFYVANGGNFFGDGTNQALGIDFAGVKGAAVTAYLANMRKNSNFVNDAEGAGMAGLQDGTVGAVFGPATLAADIKAALGENWAVAVAPAITVGEQVRPLIPFRVMDAFGIHAKSDNVRVAAKLAAFLATPEAQQARYEATANVPVSAVQTDMIKKDMTVVAVTEAAQQFSIPLPAFPEMASYWPAAEAFAAAIYNGEVIAEIADIKTAEFNTALNTPLPETPDTPDPTVPDATEATQPDVTTPEATEATVPATTAAQ